MQPRTPMPIQPMDDGPQNPRGCALTVILGLAIELVLAIVVAKWLGYL